MNERVRTVHAERATMTERRKNEWTHPLLPLIVRPSFQFLDHLAASGWWQENDGECLAASAWR